MRSIQAKLKCFLATYKTASLQQNNLSDKNVMNGVRVALATPFLYPVAFSSSPLANIKC
jgi:hypothetical protein